VNDNDNFYTAPDPDPSMQDSQRAVDEIAKQIHGLRNEGMSDTDIGWEVQVFIDSYLPLPFVVKRCVFKNNRLDVSYGAFDGITLDFSVEINDAPQ
jgi:hypothetical protein